MGREQAVPGLPWLAGGLNLLTTCAFPPWTRALDNCGGGFPPCCSGGGSLVNERSGEAHAGRARLSSSPYAGIRQPSERADHQYVSRVPFLVRPHPGAFCP